ncbi:MAG: hypothetical protein Q7R57_01095 [Dehalococcoidales bacterium]|nr:hypothetical protein [Dehalococcoidales bacterium]
MSVAVALAEPEEIEVVRVPRRKILAVPAYTDEVTAFCPKCMTMETLYFSEDGLMPSRRFHQEGKKGNYDCGAQVSCRLFRIV